MINPEINNIGQQNVSAIRNMQVSDVPQKRLKFLQFPTFGLQSKVLQCQQMLPIS